MPQHVVASKDGGLKHDTKISSASNFSLLIWQLFSFVALVVVLLTIPLVAIFFHSGGFSEMSSISVTSIRHQLAIAFRQVDPFVAKVGISALCGIAALFVFLRRGRAKNAAPRRTPLHKRAHDESGGESKTAAKHSEPASSDEGDEEELLAAAAALAAAQAAGGETIVTRTDMALLQEHTFKNSLRLSLCVMFGSSLVLYGHWFWLVLGAPSIGLLYFTYASWKKRQAMVRQAIAGSTREAYRW